MLLHLLSSNAPRIYYFLFFSNTHFFLINTKFLIIAIKLLPSFFFYQNLFKSINIGWRRKFCLHTCSIFYSASLIFSYNFYSTVGNEFPPLNKNVKKLIYNKKTNLVTVEDSKYFDVLLRYAEFLFGSRINFLVVRSPLKLLSKQDLLNILHLRAKISFWLNNTSIRNWVYVATVIIFFFKTKDSTLISSWIHVIIKKMSLFSHSRFFYLLFIFFNMSFVYFKSEYGLAGIKIRIAGKISVTGNARKRSMVFKKGTTSSNNFQTKVSYDFYLVRTKTGCLGVSIYLYYT